MQKDLRIVFMGTPGFAVPSLDILVHHKYNIVGVITAPDKPAGRGQQLHQSEVKKYAAERGLTILQPEKLKDADFYDELKSLNANLFIVVAFRMLPEKIWQMPEYGTFNLHASLLPQYRGAAPINWAIINGEKETGATTFFLQHEIDTGNILFADKISIGENDTAGIVHDRLMKLGADLVLKTVRAIENDEIHELPQDSIIANELKHAPKIFKEDCKIDWNKTRNEIHNFIRGLSPYPTAFTSLNGKTLKIYQSSLDVSILTASIAELADKETQTIVQTDNKTFLRFKCADGYLNIVELQLEGKKKMRVDEFLRGFKLN